ncbi:MAG: hypothetical protein N2Z65_03170 [Clostridiales bacterium]|nr:hypothetical protein [Clostridiales bacterium]
MRGGEPDPVYYSPVAPQAALSSLLYDSKAASYKRIFILQAKA